MFFGNDFLPSLTIFSLRERGYERAIEFYKESGNPDLSTEKGRQQFLEYSSEKEFFILNSLIKKRNNIFEKCILSTSKEECSRKYNLHILDGVLNIEPVIESYWKTYDFCITYFFTNIPKNWDWYYSYPESPLIQDIIYFSESILEESNISYTIKNQLQFILPSKTLHLIGRRIKFHDEFYIETREPWLKRYDWETKPRISLPWGTLTSIKRI
jgi:5'-3' exonuclease